MAHDVFISHARKDKGIADEICEKLESARVKCWIAERDISAGEDWTEATRNAIGSSRVMVLVFSENANAAPHIEREIAHAFYTRRIIIPVRLTKTLPRRDYLFYLGNVRWFDAFSPPAEQHLEELTASINGMVRGRTGTRDSTPPHSPTKTTTTLDFSNSWIGALHASHYQTLGILKRAGMAAALFVIGCLWWFAPWQTKNGVSPAEGNLQTVSSGPDPPLASSPQASGEASASKPAYTYSRFGLWVASNTVPAPPIEQRPQDSPSSTPVAQPASAALSPGPDVGQSAAGEAEGLRVHDSVSAHRGKPRPKAHNKRVRASEGSRVAYFKSRLRALWHQLVARSKEAGNW
jgi:TIR domain